MKRDTRGASLVPAHQFGVPLAGFGVPPFGLEGLDGRGSPAVRFAARKASRLSSCHEILPRTPQRLLPAGDGRETHDPPPLYSTANLRVWSQPAVRPASVAGRVIVLDSMQRRCGE